MSELREKVEEIVTDAACLGWNDAAMEPNDALVSEATDAIMSLIAEREEAVRSETLEALANLPMCDTAEMKEQPNCEPEMVRDWLRSNPLAKPEGDT